MTMLSRRRLVATGSLLVVSERRVLAAEGRDYALDHPLPVQEKLAANEKEKNERKHALDLMAAAPSTTPYDVFTYFAGLTDKNDDGEYYKGGWKRRYNPLIVQFFYDTGEDPSHDDTPWCATALNWALQRCGYGKTSDASSKSFRNVPGKTDTPQCLSENILSHWNRLADPS